LSEHIEQCRVVSWFRRTHPGVRIFAIPNGGWRNKTVAAKLKAEGVSAGVPDLFVPEWLTWVEMKTETGKLSPAQRDWIVYLDSIGHRVLVCRGYDDAVSKLSDLSESFVPDPKHSTPPKS